jgi:hypothetical protein
MSSVTSLRAAVLLLACTGIIDPSFQTKRTSPPAVDVQVADSDSALAVRQRLAQRLDGTVGFDSDHEPVARVIVGDVPLPDGFGGVPVSTVTTVARKVPNGRIVSAIGPGPVPAGWTATFKAQIEGSGLRGNVARLVLEHRGAQVGSVDHKWSGDLERVELSIPYAPPVEGVARMTLRLLPAGSEPDTMDNVVDVGLISTGRRMRVLVHEPRPSWASTFVRRAIERNSTFDVSARVRPTRGLAVSAGDPPPGLTFETLASFDVIVLGAPEELKTEEIDALERFVRRRGGTVVLLPDRRPAGPYLRLLPINSFSEVLVENALELSSEIAGMRATELALPPKDLPDVDVLATAKVGQAVRAAVFAASLGLGRVIFSGALDAWRFRALSGGGFARFWESCIAEAALAAPRRIEVTLVPTVTTPGEEVKVRVRLRPTEFVDSTDPVRIPPVAAHLVGEPGVNEVIRLWPSAALGVFEGVISAPAAGRYNLQVTSGDAMADQTLLSAEAAHRLRPPRQSEADRLQLVARATGGIAAAEDDLSQLEGHLRGLPRSHAQVRVHPARTWWFVLIFAGAATGEWALRRRRGLA